MRVRTGRGIAAAKGVGVNSKALNERQGEDSHRECHRVLACSPLC